MTISFTTAIAIYLILWWITLFAVLPFGVKSQLEAGEVVPGSAPSAPVAPLLKQKLIWTTIVSAAIFAVGYGLHRMGLGLDDVPFLPRY